ncbi:MAG TPA: glutamate racemase [Longimicrobiaceae bacterium]|nr:glutamate racemase [Longimicrobiaceae bacterium]
MTARPVGVFDSGVGGLSVAREIRHALPSEHILYLADTAFCPYGDRSLHEVRARTLGAGRFLQDQGAKVLVVACNTASGAALELLREKLTIPVVGLEPAVKPALAATRNGRVGVMATSGTVRSERLRRLIDTYAGDRQVIAQPCPGLADMVEDGLLEGPALDAKLLELTAPLREGQVDTVVLGCTHYLFVRDAIAAALGPDVQILDSGPAIARQTRRVLEQAGMLEAAGPGSIRFLTTAQPSEVEDVVQRLWAAPLPIEHVDFPHAELDEDQRSDAA